MDPVGWEPDTATRGGLVAAFGLWTLHAARAIHEERSGVIGVATDVVPMPSDAWRAVAPGIARAFEDQPLVVAVFPESHRRPEAMDAYMRVGFRSFLLGGVVVDTTPTLSAAAAWAPPGHTNSPMTMLRVFPQAMAWMRRAGRGDVRRFSGLMRRWAQRRNEILPEPHWYLEMLGVDPAKQRFGLGAILVRHGLARCDAAGMPAFLETDTAAKARFYEKLGFAVVEVTEDEKVPLTVWRMVRPPRTSATTAHGHPRTVNADAP